MPFDTTEIEIALNDLLTAAIEHRGARHVQDHSRPEVFRLSDLSPLEVSEVGDLIEQPVFAACRRGMKALGAYMGPEMDSASDLLAVAERVAGLDEANAGRRMEMLDWAFDRVKTKNGIWQR